MNNAATIKVEGQKGRWVLVSERAPAHTKAAADLASRGWKGWGMVRRENGKRIYIALVDLSGTFAAICG
jgi:hypothetical protein